MTFEQAAARAWPLAAQWLGWRPNDFWNATPRELADALRPPSDLAEPPSSDAIDALRKRFPD